MKKRYTASFKAQIVQEILREEKTIAQIASEHGIHPNQLSKWKTTTLQGLPSLFGDGHETAAAIKAAYQRQIDELYAEIGRLTTQVGWLKKKSGLKLE